MLAGAEAAFGDACCAECSSDGPAYERAVNYGAYTGALRQLIHLLKYERVRTAANLLGQFTAQACLQLEGDIDVPELLMLPVPVHKLRLRSRGFNQAELIARAAQRGIAESIGRRVTLDVTALLRVRFAESQVALDAETRRQQIRGAFKVPLRERVKGREILLIDDVLTTGATASECARELRRAGAVRVWVATPARALGRAALESMRHEHPHLLNPADVGHPQFVRPASSVSTSPSPGTALGSLLQRRGIPSGQGERRVGGAARRLRLL